MDHIVVPCNKEYRTASLVDTLDLPHYLTWFGDLFQQEYGQDPVEILQMIQDVGHLYQGGWDSHEACQVSYHTLGHVMEVAQVMARMMIGWNHAKHSEIGWNHAKHSEMHLSSADFLTGLSAALLHDSGYLKEKGDVDGDGGKHTFDHVQRSRKLALVYLDQQGWDLQRLELVTALIQLTDIMQPVRFEGVIGKFPGMVLGGMLGTADLVAQMADVHYLNRLPDLYAEFQEAYRSLGKADLDARGVRIFASLEELRNGTLFFFDKMVLPRLESLGNMFRYLAVFFGGERNPYMENVVANVYGASALDFRPWRRIGEMLADLGLISRDGLEAAIHFQQNFTTGKDYRNHTATGLGGLLRRINYRSGQNYLGDLLVRLGENDQSTLRRVMTEQILPDHYLDTLQLGDAGILLRIAMLLGSVRQVPRVFNQVLEMVIEMLDCQAGSLLFADEEHHALVFVMAFGPQADKVIGKSISREMGVAGWVYTNGRAAVVNEAQCDSRFFGGLDADSGFQTRSILATPLLVDNTPVGVLEVLNTRNPQGVFSDRDQVALSIVAQQLAGSLDGLLWMMENDLYPTGSVDSTTDP